MPTPPKNILFPGKPNYVGPRDGYFSCIHHDDLFDYSHDIMERVRSIKEHKASHEIPVRFDHLVSLATCKRLIDIKAKAQAQAAAFNDGKMTASQYYEWLEKNETASVKAVFAFLKKHIGQKKFRFRWAEQYPFSKNGHLDFSLAVASPARKK
jgi:hypothetical protein